MSVGTASKSKSKPKSKAQKAHPKKPKEHNRHRALWWGGGILAAFVLLITAVIVAFQVSPWPGALLIRYEFDKGGAKTSKALEKHVPPGITEVANQHYRAHDPDAYLDVFYPKDTTRPRPTVVWVHGGAWISGNKDDVDNYLKIVASKGYTVVGVNYSIAPGKKYPTPVLQVNDALRYVQRHADRLHIDKNQIVLAGDSAGSQIAAQVATIISNPGYAREIGIAAPITNSQLKAMVLNCGAYDLALPNYNGEDGKFLKIVLWAYSGTKNFLDDKNIQYASVQDYVNHDFPPSFITAGNADPLESQSREFAQRLAKLDVPTDPLFYAADHQPKLEHEYQFNLDIADGRRALVHITEFLASHTTQE